MTEVTLKLSGFPVSRVIGSGTILDTARFRTDLGYHLGISPKSLHANVLGEHGDSEVLCWSNGDGGTIPLNKLAQKLNKPLTSDVKKRIDDDVRNAAYKIIEGKGATFYGIAGGLCRICQAISTNEYAILTVSTHHQEILGIKNVSISMPTVIGKRGVHNVLYPELSEEETQALKASVEKMKKLSEAALAMI
jgi:L-lactate dehydrogenase